MGEVDNNSNNNSSDNKSELADVLKSISSESLICDWIYTLGGEELALTSQEEDSPNRHEATKIMNKAFLSINDLSNKLKLGPTGDIYGELSSSQAVYQCGVSVEDSVLSQGGTVPDQHVKDKAQPILVASGVSRKGDSFGAGLASTFEVREATKAFIRANW